MDTVKRRVARTCQVEVIAGVSAESVWRVIADVTRTGEWSHECLHVTWLGGAAAAAPGARFRGRNRSGWLRWSRTCEVLAVDPPRQIAWRTVPTPLFVDSSDWRITLEPAGTGTRIVQAFELTRCPRWWEWIVTRVNPRHIDRSAALTEDLHRIAAVATADARRIRTGDKDHSSDGAAAAGDTERDALRHEVILAQDPGEAAMSLGGGPGDEPLQNLAGQRGERSRP